MSAASAPELASILVGEPGKPNKTILSISLSGIPASMADLELKVLCPCKQACKHKRCEPGTFLSLNCFTARQRQAGHAHLWWRLGFFRCCGGIGIGGMVLALENSSNCIERRGNETSTMLPVRSLQVFAANVPKIPAEHQSRSTPTLRVDRSYFGVTYVSESKRASCNVVVMLTRSPYVALGRFVNRNLVLEILAKRNSRRWKFWPFGPDSSQYAYVASSSTYLPGRNCVHVACKKEQCHLSTSTTRARRATSQSNLQLSHRLVVAVKGNRQC